MTYKRIIPCIFIKDGKAVKWFDNLEVIDEDPIALAKFYNLHGADELLIFCLLYTSIGGLLYPQL